MSRIKTRAPAIACTLLLVSACAGWVACGYHLGPMRAEVAQEPGNVMAESMTHPKTRSEVTFLGMGTEVKRF